VPEILTGENVEKVYAACLYSDEETVGWDGTEEGLPEGTIVTEGILVDAGLAQLDEVLMPFMIATDDRTMYQVYRANAMKEIAS